ncbi:hypothetical protein EUTSA_v10022973mg [Eutrema salsugineum]|uniref:F-box domain-containing protein n=1 Tax=Eutrema salsugineum TaxID=72664 RepID=V4MEI9_EUTSA|nr:hypothetical protein EUTSA_v10022973mg [Eutrema salsugineum]
MIDWSMLPKEVLLMIAVRLYSDLELLHFRSTCKSWRSSISVADDNPLPSRPLITDMTVQEAAAAAARAVAEAEFAIAKAEEAARVAEEAEAEAEAAFIFAKAAKKALKFMMRSQTREVLSHTSFFRVSSSNQGWLIKCDTAGLTYGEKFDFLESAVTGRFRYWNGVIWSRIKDQVARFCDIMIHRGLAYALDSNGIVWWISSSFDIFRYGPSLYENITNDSCRDLTLVECYIVDLIHDDVGITRCELSQRNYYTKTVGFKVYKVDEELKKWVQVQSGGDNALVMATDTCFSVSPHEFNGYLPNSIYLSDEDEYEISMFKLDECSIMTSSGYSQTCFQMFVPRFH